MILTSSALVGAGNRFARALDALDVPVRGNVAVLAGNIPEFLAAYRGTTWSGRQFTPMSWRWSQDDVAYVIDCVDGQLARLKNMTSSVGALPSEHCAAIFKKFMKKWEEVEAQESAKAAADAAQAATAPAANAAPGA